MPRYRLTKHRCVQTCEVEAPFATFAVDLARRLPDHAWTTTRSEHITGMILPSARKDDAARGPGQAQSHPDTSPGEAMNIDLALRAQWMGEAADWAMDAFESGDVDTLKRCIKALQAHTRLLGYVPKAHTD
jgi:hypothetical protein